MPATIILRVRELPLDSANPLIFDFITLLNKVQDLPEDLTPFLHLRTADLNLVRASH